MTSLIYAGIDEAGYGPLLGPLTIGASVFRVENADPADGPPNLWKLLNNAVCRSPRDKRGRVAIDDSKKLKGANDAKSHPLRHLERGVLAMFDTAPGDDAELFERLGVTAPEATWYDSTSPLPLAIDPAQLRIAASRLHRACAASDVHFEGLQCEAIDADAFNSQFDRCGNKAQINFAAILRLVDRIWTRWQDVHPRVVVDRQGGRTHYLEDLQFAWPDAQLRIVCETEACSRYVLTENTRSLTISFEKESESRHLPVALASMTAKLVRELLMLRLNRYFAAHLPDLQPTAGYVADGRRFVQDIEIVIRSQAIDRARLVRKA